MRRSHDIPVYAAYHRGQPLSQSVDLSASLGHAGALGGPPGCPVPLLSSYDPSLARGGSPARGAGDPRGSYPPPSMVPVFAAQGAPGRRDPAQESVARASTELLDKVGHLRQKLSVSTRELEETLLLLARGQAETGDVRRQLDGIQKLAEVLEALEPSGGGPVGRYGRAAGGSAVRVLRQSLEGVRGVLDQIDSGELVGGHRVRSQTTMAAQGLGAAYRGLGARGEGHPRGGRPGAEARDRGYGRARGEGYRPASRGRDEPRRGAPAGDAGRAGGAAGLWRAADGALGALRGACERARGGVADVLAGARDPFLDAVVVGGRDGARAVAALGDEARALGDVLREELLRPVLGDASSSGVVNDLLDAARACDPRDAADARAALHEAITLETRVARDEALRACDGLCAEGKEELERRGGRVDAPREQTDEAFALLGEMRSAAQRACDDVAGEADRALGGVPAGRRGGPRSPGRGPARSPARAEPGRADRGRRDLLGDALEGRTYKVGPGANAYRSKSRTRRDPSRGRRRGEETSETTTSDQRTTGEDAGYRAPPRKGLKPRSGHGKKDKKSKSRRKKRDTSTSPTTTSTSGSDPHRRGYAPKNHMDLPAGLVVAHDRYGSLSVPGLGEKEWAGMSWREVKQAQRRQYEKELAEWKEKRERHERERRKMPRDALLLADWASGDELESPPRRPALFQSSGEPVKHAHAWAPAPQGMPEEREGKQAPPAYTINNSRLLQMHHKNVKMRPRLEARVREIRQEQAGMAPIPEIERRISELRARHRELLETPGSQRRDLEGVARAAKDAVKELGKAEALVEELERLQRAFKKKEEEFAKLARAELRRMWDKEEEQFEGPMRELAVRARKLPTEREVERMEQSARAYREEVAPGDRDGAARADRALDKCRRVAEERRGIEAERARVHKAIRRRLAPFLAQVSAMSQEMGFRDPLAGGPDEARDDADERSRVGALGAATDLGAYPKHLIRREDLFGVPDGRHKRDPRAHRADPLDPEGEPPAARRDATYRASDLAAWESREEMERFTRNVLDKFAGEGSEEDDWGNRFLDRQLSLGGADRHHGRRGRGPGDREALGPVSAESIWKELDARRASRARGAQEEDDGGDVAAGLEHLRGAGDEPDRRDRRAGGRGPKPEVKDGTLLYAVEAFARWKGADTLRDLWRDYGAHGDALSVDALGDLLNDALTVEPLREELRFVATLVDTSGESRVSIRDFIDAADGLIMVRDGALVVPRGSRVGVDEFMTMMARKCRGVTGGLERVFEHFDLDGSGDIDWSEATKMVATLLPGLRDKEKRDILMHVMSAKASSYGGRAEGVTLQDMKELLAPYLARLDAPAGGIGGLAGGTRGAQARDALEDTVGALVGWARREMRKLGKASEQAEWASFLFSRFSRSGTGKLAFSDVQRMVKSTGADLPKGAARTLWHLLDMNGDGDVDREEFKNAMDDAVAMIKAEDKDGAPGATLRRTVLMRMARRAREAGGVAAYLLQYDRNRSGQVESSELVRMMRNAMPSLRDVEARTLMMELGALDTDGDGRLDKAELAAALKPFMDKAPSNLDMFGVLDDYLKASGLAFRDYWQRYEQTFNGVGGPTGLRFDAFSALVQNAVAEVAKRKGESHEVTQAQLEYVWKILDINGDGRISAEEALQIYEHVTRHGGALKFKDRVDVNDYWRRIALIVNEPGKVDALFRAYDADQDLALGPRDLVRLFRDTLPGTTNDEIQAVLVNLGSADASSDGRISRDEMVAALLPYWSQAVKDAVKAAGASGRAGMGPGGAAEQHSTLLTGLLSVPQPTLVSEFRKLDASGRGLVRADVFVLARRLVPSVKTTDGMLRYLSVVMDVDGSGAITLEELLQVLDMARDLRSSIPVRGVPDVDGAFARVGGALGTTAEADRLFAQHAGGGGSLDGAQLARLFRAAVPELSVRELQAMLLRMRDLDADGTGTISRAEFFAAVGKHLSAPAAAPAPAPHAAPYAAPGAASPAPVVPQSVVRRQINLFADLDEHLKQRGSTLDALWARHDPLGHGLDRAAVRRLVQEIAPDVALSEGQLRSLSCMLDIDGDGRVTKKELLDNFSMFTKLGQNLTATEDGLTGDQLLQRLATLLQSPTNVEGVFKKYDAAAHHGRGDGRLDADELLRMLGDAVPAATADEKRALLYSLSTHDADGDGFISLPELQAALAPFFGGQGAPPAAPAPAAPAAAAASRGVSFFKDLDAHLRAHRSDLDTLWARHDPAGRGLNAAQLAGLVREVAADLQVSEGKARVLAAMLDVDGDGHVTKEELVSNFEMFSRLGMDLEVTDDGLTLTHLLQRLATLLQSPENVEGVFRKYDGAHGHHDGRLDADELMRMLQDAVPSATAREKQALLCSLSSRDTDGDGYITLPELQAALAPHFTATSLSASGSHLLLDRVVQTLRATPSLLRDACNRGGHYGSPPSAQWDAVLRQALPFLSPDDAGFLRGVLRLQVRDATGAAPAREAGHEALLQGLEAAWGAARGLVRPGDLPALAALRAWAGAGGAELYRAAHDLTGGNTGAEMPCEYLERLVETWGAGQSPLDRATAFMWLRDSDRSGRFRLTVPQILASLNGLHNK